jgi:signal transduction histidine kinase
MGTAASSFFMPHGHCYLWQPAMVWLQVGTNVAIGLAYVAISAMLTYVVYRFDNLPFKWIYACFGAFIVSCGVTHFFEVVTIWYPAYWLDGTLRAITAAASVGTALLMPGLLPQALALIKGAQAAQTRGIVLETAVRDLASLLESTQRTRDILQQENATYSSDMETLALAVSARRQDLQKAVHTARLAQLEAEKANRYKDDFLSMVSHELRTPLTAIDLQMARMTRALRRTSDPLQPAQQAHLIGQVDLSIRRLEHVIESLLQHTRLKDGQLILQESLFDLSVLLQRIRDEAAALGRSKELDIVLQWTGTGPKTVELDPHILRLVLDNLISNAIKFSPQKARIVIDVNSDVDSLSIAISDQGPGISEQLQASIFEPFVHLESVAHKHTPGVGLGLALVRDMVFVMHGKLDLHSTPGVGSRFRVTFSRSA